MRELLDMTKGRQMHEWDIASAQMALLANINRDAKKRARPYSPADFHPLRDTPLRGMRITRANIKNLKALARNG